jgi:phosphoglycolate phosphatase-like HAD superfamily hydrolase
VDGSESVGELRALPRTKAFFVGIDSDGCAFDTMEIKQKECFIPNTISHWDLQAVCRFVRETEEWVNLYSKWRGSNRFPALVKVFDLLAERPECLARGYRTPEIGPLRTWIQEETRLGNPALAEKVEETNDPVLRRALAWSLEINEAVAKIVRGIPAFPYVRESLQKLAPLADQMVVSATPNEALAREWAEHELDRYVRMICGQEMGTKAEQIQHGAVGKYAPEEILMIGDALGDMRSAKANHALFYPINPGREAESWRRFYEEAADKFLAGEYGGRYEQELIEEFLTYLPSEPPWKTAGG